MSTMGSDAQPYLDWMDRCTVERSRVTIIDESYTAQAFITTDQDDNQITAFHPGAMNFSHQNQVPTDAGISLGMISPDGRQGMIEHAAQFAEAGIPFIFDPGQGLPMFDGEDLLKFLDQATWLAVNDYELKLVQERTGLTLAALSERVSAVIVTRGGEGSSIYADGREIEIPVASPKAVLDPTGCGDAYRAGLLYGLMRAMDWETTGRIASLMGATKIESVGPQNHRFTLDAFAERFNESFG